MRKMNKFEIIDAAVTHYDEKQGCWVTQSYVDPDIIGVADEKALSRQIFEQLVDAEWEEYKKGRHGIYSKAGRPAKNKVDLRAQVEAEVRMGIQELEDKIGVSSQGEAVEYLYHFYMGHRRSLEMQNLIGA